MPQPRWSLVLLLLATAPVAATLRGQCVPRDSLGNEIPDTIPDAPPIGYRQLRLYYGKGTLTQLTPGSQVPVYGDTMVNGCQTMSYRMELHPTVAVLPDIFLVDSQPHVLPAALDTVEVNKGRRLESHPPLLDTLTGKPTGGVNETTYYYLRFAVYRGPDPTAITAQLWTFGDSATDPRDFTEVPYTDATKTKVEYIFSVALLSFGQRGFYPGPFEHRYILDSVHTGPLQSTNFHTSVDLSPPLARTLFWDPRYLGRGIHWFRPWQYRKDRTVEDTIETFEQALVFPHTDFSVLLIGSAPVAALAAENQRVDTVWQVIRDWDSTVFTGDSSARDYRHFVDPSQLYLWGFVFNPRSPYKPLNFGDTASGDTHSPPEFYLGPNRRFQWTRLLDTLHVSLIARDAYNLRDSVPILVRSRGLRISRLRFQTRDPNRRARQRCYGVGCIDQSPHGGFEGMFPPKTVDVVYDTTGLNMEVLAGGFRDDLATMDTMSWRITPNFWTRIEGHGRNPTLRSDPASTWPDFNYSWGGTVLFASVTLDTFRLVEAVGVRLFFPRDARVQPISDQGGIRSAPNWFHYWIEVIRSTPGIENPPGVNANFHPSLSPVQGQTFLALTQPGGPGQFDVYFTAYNEQVTNNLQQLTSTTPLFRHFLPCSRATVSANGWQFPNSDADDLPLAVAANIPHVFGGQMPTGYCRIPGVNEQQDGIRALALTWQHEMGHVLHERRMETWAQAAGCAGVACGGIVTGGVAIPGALLYWNQSAIGAALGCHGLLNPAGQVVQSVVHGQCGFNVRRWMEFVADMKRYELDNSVLDDLRLRDWAYPGSQYGH